MKENCKIVQDLLPNYIEKLTSEETNVFIENHLKECNECNEILENMQKVLKVKEQKSDGREVKYIKKVRNKIKLLEAIIVIILAISLGVAIYYCYYFQNYSKHLEQRMAEEGIQMYEVLSEKMYPNTFYGIIEKIEDTGIINNKKITIRTLKSEEENSAQELYFYVDMENIGDNFKIRKNGKNVYFEQLKVGQTVAVYNYKLLVYAEDTEPNCLEEVKMIDILKDK